VTRIYTRYVASCHDCPNRQARNWWPLHGQPQGDIGDFGDGCVLLGCLIPYTNTISGEVPSWCPLAVKE